MNFQTLRKINACGLFNRVFAATEWLGVCALILTATAARAGDPSIDWRKIQTEHFEILFDSRHYFTAREFAIRSEQAWKTLVPVMRTWPDKTVVILDDSGDQANGMATGFPYPQVRLMLATPNPGETIADTGPWGLELITHEYTHVLNFQPAHGVMHLARNVFGSIIRPNLLLPRWYSEGLAVEMETRFSPSGGRLRSPDFLAIPRAMVQDDLLRKEDISRVNEVSIPDWPGGARPYLLGGLMWSYLNQEDLSTPGQLNDRFAERLPFFVEEPLREKKQLEWSDLLDSVYSDIEGKSVNQIERLCEGGCDEGQHLGEPGYFSRSPVLSKDGQKLAWLSREHNHDGVLMVAKHSAASGETPFEVAGAARVAEPTGATRVAWAGENLIYDKIDSVGRYEERTDLWIYDSQNKKNIQLTRGLRAREPDAFSIAASVPSAVTPKAKAGASPPSPTSAETYVVPFVKLMPSKTELAMTTVSRKPDGNWRIGAIETLYKPSGENRVAWPTMISDTELVFVERSTDGREEIFALELKSKRPRRIDLSDSNGAQATFPRWIDHQPKGLLFASNRSGVTNLYFAKQTREGLAGGFAKPIPLTNSVTRAWVGDLEPKSRALLYSRLDGDGSHLRRLTNEASQQNATVASGRLKKLEPLVAPPPEFTPPTSTLSLDSLKAEEFSAWPYLLPRYWMPFASYVPGGVFLSASTSSGDPIGHHALAASVSTDTRIGKPNGFFAYSNSQTSVKITGLGDDTWQRLSTGLDRRTTTLDLSGVFYIPGLANEWSGEASFSSQRSELISTSASGVVNDVRIRGGPRLGILWSDLGQKGKEISPESGGFSKLSHAVYRPEFGNQVYDKTDLTATGYFSKVSAKDLLGWLPDRHVLVVSGGISWAPNLDRLLLGPSSLSLSVESIALGAVGTSFVMRGYPSGAFIGRKLARSSIEYRMPLSYSYHGFDTNPAFVQRWHAALFVDGISADGAFYDYEINGYRSAYLGSIYGAIGAEARMDTTIFYHLPFQVIFGIHYGFDKRINPNGAYPIISFAL